MVAGHRDPHFHGPILSSPASEMGYVAYCCPCEWLSVSHVLPWTAGL